MHIFVITKTLFFLFNFFLCRETANVEVLDDIPKLPALVNVSVYDTKPDHFLLICCNTIKWVQKTCKVYDPE